MQQLFFVLILMLGTSDLTFAQAVDINVDNLSKKWKLEEYSVLGFSEKPTAEEAEDYIYLKTDKTFVSVSTGKYEEGFWQLDVENNRISFTKEGEAGILAFFVEKLESNLLILYIDDPTDAEAEYLKIHFKG